MPKIKIEVEINKEFCGQYCPGYHGSILFINSPIIHSCKFFPQKNLQEGNHWRSVKRCQACKDAETEE